MTGAIAKFRDMTSLQKFAAVHAWITVLCRDVEGLPVGFMLTGAQFYDATVPKVARAYMIA